MKLYLPLWEFEKRGLCEGGAFSGSVLGLESDISYKLALKPVEN